LCFFGADILFVLNMPPKKVTTVTLDKCGRCFKKHAPPLGDKCLALQLDPEITTDDNPDEEISEGLPDDEILEQPDDNLGAVGGPLLPKDPGNTAVAAQLANLTSVVSHLAGLYESTRQEVGSLRSEVASLRQSRAAPVSNSVPVMSVASVVASAPVSSAPAVTAAVSGIPSVNALDADSLIPSLASLRADAGLVTQAENLVSNLGNPVAGNFSLTSTKRGSVRCGGDLKPYVQVPWPQDFVMGSGASQKFITRT
jgi:hypothetical protein